MTLASTTLTARPHFRYLSNAKVNDGDGGGYDGDGYDGDGYDEDGDGDDDEDLGDNNSDCKTYDKYHRRVDLTVHPEPSTHKYI